MNVSNADRCIARRRRLVYALLRGVVALILVAGFGPITRAATMSVAPALVEIDPGDGLCSLMEALENANDDAQTHPDCPTGTGPDVIELAAGSIYTLTQRRLSLSTAMTIEGNGSTVERDENAPQFGIFFAEIFFSGLEITLKNLTIRNGQTNLGGGIFHGLGALTLMNCTITECTAGEGGGIWNLDGTLNVVESTISHNVALAGAGIWNVAILNVYRSTISHNHCGEFCDSSQGGGIWNRATLNMTDSTVSYNTMTNGFAGAGAGIYNAEFSSMDLSNCTISHNMADFGGGIRNNEATARLTNCTITENSATRFGGGINSGSSGSVELANCIVADQELGSDCSGSAVTSLGYNLDSDGSCNLTGPGDIPNGFANLGLLNDNGGPTETHALRFGSDAIDAGNPAVPGSGEGACEVKDQRGVPRPQRAACDIGAFEWEPEPNGGPCESRVDCLSGFCVDGLCCDTACDGVCELCDQPGFAGRCTNIALGSDPDNECPPCETCNGAGVCTTRSCAPFACDPPGPSCRTSCASDDDCSVDAACQPGDVCVFEDQVIPTVSTWGLVVLALFLLTAGKIHFGLRLER